MELTDDRIERIRSWLDRRGMIDEEISALIDMALAHNAAKRQEPVARKDTVIDKPSFGPERKYPKLFGEGNWRHLPDGTKLYTTPPDLAAKLREARELLEKAVPHLSNSYGDSKSIKNEINDFLAGTK